MPASVLTLLKGDHSFNCVGWVLKVEKNDVQILWKLTPS